MNYSDAINYLYGFERFGIKLGLDNIKELLGRLENPHLKFKAVHVTGTNGKGSVCAFLASILRRAGYRVGLYTSPHLLRFNERIRVDVEEITDEDVIRLLLKIKPIAEEMAKESKAKQPTFFEISTAMAFKYFAEKNVDVAVVEVGMGGRLDATNVVNPLVSIITHVDLEHTEHLGKTIERIAMEKAGIIKKSVPVVTAEKRALEVIKKKCKEMGCLLSVVGQDIKYKGINSNLDGQRLIVEGGNRNEIEIKLIGTYQIENAATAYAAVEALQSQGLNIPKEALLSGFLETKWPARLEIISRNPRVILDITHNPDGAKKLKESLIELFKWDRLIFILGILNDKDLRGIARELGPIASEIIATKPRTERAQNPYEIKRAFEEYTENIIIIEDVKEAVEQTISKASKGDIVCITGSIYTAGEAMEYFQERR